MIDPGSRYLFLVILASLRVFNSCQDLGSSASEETGIQGQVYSITTPGPVPEGWTPPPLERVSTIVVLDVNRKHVKEFATDEKGRFKTYLQPGTYFLRVKESLIPAQTGPYVVMPGQILSVEAHYDSGMR
ncbi:MAG: hypothetical protein AABZ02_10175 [Bacteroidota bacterium]